VRANVAVSGVDQTPHKGSKVRRSFLKKRTKKLLSVSDSTEFTRPKSVPVAMDKSFLLLFFKKEGLCCLYFPSAYLGSYPDGRLMAGRPGEPA